MKLLGRQLFLSSLLVVVTACGRAEIDTGLRRGPDDADVATLRDGAVTDLIAPDSPILAPDYVPPRYQEFALQAAAEFFCPSGFAYDTASLLCANEKEALGPFTAKMVENCHKYGGGPACDGSRWSKSFAEKIRGKAECADGAVRVQSGLCVEGESAFGPFTRKHVEACKAAGGGPACESNRWNKAFAERILPSDNPAKRELSGVKIAIDSGHGRFSTASLLGFDVGAVSPYFRDVIEWERNADVGGKLKSRLESLGASVSFFTYPNQSGIQYLTLEQKGSRSVGHDLFVSVHHNSFNGSAQGSEVFVHPSSGTQDQSLAAAIQRALVRVVWNGASTYNRGVKSANLGVLRGVPAAVEGAVLVEGFFLDTKAITLPVAKEMDVLVADAVAKGVAEYWVSEH